MKKTILIILAAVLVLTVACRNNPEVRNGVVPNTHPIQWQDETVVTAEYSLNVDCVPNMSEAKVVEDSYSFFIRMDRVFCRAVTHSEALGPNDLSILDLTGNGKIYLYEGVMQYKQPDEGLGKRDWTIKFYALMDSEDLDDENMHVESPESEGSFGIPMYIYGAHGVESLRSEDVEISDAELGFQSSLLDGWLTVEISDFEGKSEKETETRNGTVRTYNITHKYRFPQSFRLSIMDISGVSEETKKISSLPALDTRMLNEKFSLR